MYRKLAVVSVLALVLMLGALAILPQGNVVQAQFEVTSATVTGTTTLLPGTSYSIVASGFTEDEVVEILIDNTRLSRGAANASGVFTGTVKIVSQFVQGTHTLTARNDARTDSASYEVTVNPALIVSATGGAVGTEVPVSGFGFKVGEAYTITFASAIDTTQSDCISTTATVSETVATGTTSSIGTIYETVTVPDVDSGTYYFVAIGGTSAICAED